ncbi:TRADD-N-associated membrane domain-containing protein [Chryseobacterium taichungense]|uniref:TRADD-N-associated membrane domain-containing protein n=1 Tax=Chryseobacterium taichungense TaxID=295069 RepID=UPI0028B1783D|nr:hypothetical protein [Chryseobacterium taichungense]
MENRVIQHSETDSLDVLKKKKELYQQRLKSQSFTWWGWLLSTLIGGIGGYSFISMNGFHPISVDRLIPYIFIGILCGGFLYAYPMFTLRMIFSNALRRIELELVKHGTEELQENISENFFTKLVQINFKYLDQYYLQTQEQADKSFRLSSFAAISGLIIILIGILMMYSGKTEPAYVTTTAGLLSEFIASVFFYLYNRTILKMSQYHQKLVLTQNISLALKITDEMKEEQKNKALELLIDRLTIDVNKYLTETKE